MTFQVGSQESFCLTIPWHWGLDLTNYLGISSSIPCNIPVQRFIQWHSCGYSISGDPSINIYPIFFPVSHFQQPGNAVLMSPQCSPLDHSENAPSKSPGNPAGITDGKALCTCTCRDNALKTTLLQGISCREAAAHSQKEFSLGRLLPKHSLPTGIFARNRDTSKPLMAHLGNGRGLSFNLCPAPDIYFTQNNPQNYSLGYI